MDHLYDYTFAPNYTTTNTHFALSGGPTHVSPSLAIRQSTQAPNYPATHFDYCSPRQLVSGTDVPRRILPYNRLPLFAQPLGFASDLQPSAPTLRHTAPPWHYSTEVGSSLTASSFGSRPSPSTVVPVSLSTSVPIPLGGTYVPATHALLHDRCELLAQQAVPSSSASSRKHDSSMATQSLRLEDICHLESVVNPTLSTLSFPEKTDMVEGTPPTPLDQAYSGCPAADFSAPTWCPPSCSVSMSFGSFSDSGSIVETSPKKESDDAYLCFSPSPHSMDLDSFGPAPLLGIFVDVNLREQAFLDQSPPVCVNPADIMGSSSGEPSPEPPEVLDSHGISPSNSSDALAILPDARVSVEVERQLSQTPDFTADFSDDVVMKNDFPDEAISAIVSVLSSSIKKEMQEPTILQPGALPQIDPALDALAVSQPQASICPNNGAGMSHPSLVYPPNGSRAPFPGPRMPFADLQQQQIQQIPVPQFGAYPSFALSSAPTEALVPPPPPMSPVLNAHAGIELEELRQRATDFRMRHPGAELDRAFLQCFAGRLTARGELMDEYRCYVVGCGQRNKRRDHILVHVGSHVEHRPWQCRHCGMRFLRKNECKRHETSHEGRKPFSCSLCAPHQERNFVRQDLLKRHMRVTHGVHDTSRATAASRKRQEGRRDENVERWL